MSNLKFTSEELTAFREEYCKGATDGQFTLFIAECERRNLVPGQHVVFQLRATKEWDPVLKVSTMVKKMVKITTIDALRLISQRTNQYEGQGEGEFYYLDANKAPTVVSKIPLPHATIPNAPREPWAAAVPIYRKGFREPVKVVARFDAYAVLRKNGEAMVLSEVWARRAPEMLLKCAEAAARRAAFPEELAGLYLSEEFEKDQPEIETHPPVPLAAAPTAPVIPAVNHAPAVISDAPRPGELVQIIPAPPAADPEPKGVDFTKAIKKKRKPSVEELPVQPANPEFQATDDDLPAIMFEDDEKVQKMDIPPTEQTVNPLTKKEIGDKVRSFYDMASAAEISKYILGKTGAKSSGEVTQEQWAQVFTLFDAAKINGKEAFQKLLKGE